MTLSHLIVIGASAGGLNALSILLSGLPADFPAPLAVVQHQTADAGTFLPIHLDGLSKIHVTEARDKIPLLPGWAYISPANYHLLVEPNRALSLSVDPPVRFSRPSIDVLFESAAVCFGPGTVGIVLTGASDDGSRGLKRIRERGGFAIVQDPATAESSMMPQSAIQMAGADEILRLEEIASYLERRFAPRGPVAENALEEPNEAG